VSAERPVWTVLSFAGVSCSMRRVSSAASRRARRDRSARERENGPSKPVSRFAVDA
jgi:hypothetical protein